MSKLLLLALILITVPLSAARADDVDDAAGLGDMKADQAAQNNGKTKIIYRKKTAVSFDDAVVEGTTNNPEGVYVVTPPPTTFGSLLKLRPNFHRELMRDALLLK